MLISIVIPTYNEPNLHETLNELAKQTVFTKYPDKVEVIIADQDPERNSITWNSYMKMKKFSKNIVTCFVGVDKKGIAYGRHYGIMASEGKVIVNFDADAKFATDDAIEKLTEPILKGEVTITCCDNILDNQFNLMPDLETAFTLQAFQLFNQLQRDHLIVCLEPGMCFTRHAYDYVGGFNDVKQGEALFLSPRIIYSFGLFCKRHISDTSVISSARRINAIGKVGLLNALNYDNAFRPS